MSPKSSANALRAAFIEFFSERDHEVVPSGPLILPNDPSLMFANAGMVQFKDVFTGREQRGYARATTSQKCIRISGKHNDLEAVGPSPRHQTFFEMLGNFSFGDYFKEEAIVYAWDFLIGTLDLPKDRLICTYFEGDQDVPCDETARELWRKVSGLSEDRILGLNADENFWQMGDTGPCGPSSEIYYYNGPSVDLRSFGKEQTPAGEGWIEIWNLVFMQYERLKEAGGSKLLPLPKPSIDTGAGLERLTSVAQEKMSNYDVDLLRELVARVAKVAKKTYRASMSDDDVSMRVIADHARTTAFLIAEGVLPDRTGSSYVLRRVMRRAVRHGHRLGIGEPFLHEIAGMTADLMGEQYPDLVERRELIESVARGEEVRFRETVQRGLTLLDERFSDLEKRRERTLQGADVFKLYDTFGFPPDLTEVICKERGYTADMQGYQLELEAARARSEFKGQTEAVLDVYLEVAKGLAGGVRFTGYDADEGRARVVALIVDGTSVESAGPGQEVSLVAESTPFYGEAGGQVGDRGAITASTGAKMVVNDTTKPSTGIVAHHGMLEVGTLRVGDEVRLVVDVARRTQIRRNHSVTHLLHWALRRVLGPHAQQKGSLVGPDRLRFDFTQNKPLSAEEIARIEDLVNQEVLKNGPVSTEVCSMEEARKRGAMMIFEEKYGDTVRVLSMGPSTELCGGTHARATGDIGLFKIHSEQGVAAGVRRIVATSGEGSLAYLREIEAQLGAAARTAKAAPATLVDRIEKLQQNQRELEKEVERLQRKLLSGSSAGGLDALMAQVRDVGGVKVLGVLTEVSDRAALRELAEQLRDKLGEAVVLVASESAGKAQLVLTVSRSLNKRFKAGELIRPVAAKVGGSGGGRPDMAQAGGPDADKLREAIEAVYEAVAAVA